MTINDARQQYEQLKDELQKNLEKKRMRESHARKVTRFVLAIGVVVLIGMGIYVIKQANNVCVKASGKSENIRK